jgi:hypothetical protein
MTKLYVNTKIGDDNNPGTVLSPWRTEEHARRQAHKILDEIYINRGDGKGYVLAQARGTASVARRREQGPANGAI